MFLLFLSGILLSFIASVPPGPVNLWLVNQALARPQSRHQAYIWGVITADLTYIAVAMWSYFFWLQSTKLVISSELTFLSGAFITFLGLVSLWRNHQRLQKPPNTQIIHQYSEDYFIGLVICGSNIMLLVFWLFMANLLASYQLFMTEMPDYLAFMLGCLLGDWLWFNGLAWLLGRGINLISPNLLWRFQTLTALGLIAFGLFTACR
jgi:threonine/homoserine/homoserine lactone efflux protein